MYVSAVTSAAHFTRPILQISRYYGSIEVFPGTATLFFVNQDGWALTCKHVVDSVLASEYFVKRRADFNAELTKVKSGKDGRKQLKKIERKYQYDKQPVLELKSLFMDCIEGGLNFDWHVHPSLDIGLLHFRGYSKLLVDKFPVFARDGDSLQPGKSLCRLGFPFPEFSNFAYDKTKDAIDWTTSGSTNVPRFPIDGMVSRLLGDPSMGTIGFEMTTPGLKGQSGGPAFDTSGIIWGMQAQTKHLDLDFDVSEKVVRQGKRKQVDESAWLHVGMCIHVEQLKSFMRENGVDFTEK